jgi:phospholipid transport system transporter-binding protein
MLTLGASLTNRNAAQVLRDGLALLAQGATQVDCGALRQLDSAALSVLLGWKRAAAGLQRTLEVVNMPPQLASLAQVYGLDQLLALPAVSISELPHRH